MNEACWVIDCPFLTKCSFNKRPSNIDNPENNAGKKVQPVAWPKESKKVYTPFSKKHTQAILLSNLPFI